MLNQNSSQLTHSAQQGMGHLKSGHSNLCIIGKFTQQNPEHVPAMHQALSDAERIFQFVEQSLSGVMAQLICGLILLVPVGEGGYLVNLKNPIDKRVIKVTHKHINVEQTSALSFRCVHVEARRALRVCRAAGASVTTSEACHTARSSRVHNFGFSEEEQ